MERLEIYDIEDDTIFYKDINISKYFESYETNISISPKWNVEDDNLINSNYELFFSEVNDQHQKEYFYLKAIKNLIKQRDFLTLINQYDNSLINDEEFSLEIENHSEKYSINVDETLNLENIKILSNIIEKLNIELHESDITEIFSINIFSNKTIFKSNILE